MTGNHPHPKNGPGPFYVVHGYCTSCNVPCSLPAFWSRLSQGFISINRTQTGLATCTLDSVGNSSPVVWLTRNTITLPPD